MGENANNYAPVASVLEIMYNIRILSLLCMNESYFISLCVCVAYVSPPSDGRISMEGPSQTSN